MDFEFKDITDKTLELMRQEHAFLEPPKETADQQIIRDQSFPVRVTHAESLVLTNFDKGALEELLAKSLTENFDVVNFLVSGFFFFNVNCAVEDNLAITITLLSQILTSKFYKGGEIDRESMLNTLNQFGKYIRLTPDEIMTAQAFTLSFFSEV